ncbi:gustatory and pheromone receptor 32a [Fopius arisanus]|uniref:Gustatory receptor n=1 Tax=Fopius arisanus TaxID=64838 RepID=A0A9R1TGU2_9HYME|nr:PREDICTED: gustatory and pheromone receptor 32a [Fopius arisanus]
MVKISDELREFDERFGTQLFGTSANLLDYLSTCVSIGLMLIIWTGLVIVEVQSENGVIYLIDCGLSAVFVSWSLVHCSVIIDAIRFRFQRLNNTLIATATYRIFSKDGSLIRASALNDRRVVTNLLMIKRARNQIYKVFLDVSGLFSSPVFVLILYCSSCCIIDIYFFIMSLVEPMGDDACHIFFDSFFWILVSLYPIIVLSASVNRFQTEANRTVDVVYDIMEAYAANREIGLELNNFAVELLHRKIDFSACGLFSLDCSLLRSLLGTIVTYLLILVQFKAPESSPKAWSN